MHKILLLLIIIIILFCLLFYFCRKLCNKIYLHNLYQEYQNNEFRNFLPRTSLGNNTIPFLEEIFKSRELYLNDSKISKKYIQFIRPINKKNIKEDILNQIHLFMKKIIKKR